MTEGDEIAELLDALPEAPALDTRLSEARRAAEYRDILKELNVKLKAENHRQDALALIREHAPRLSVPRLALQVTEHDQRRSLVLLLSDWQIGQVTTSNATGGVFEQTTEIAQEQIQLLVQRLVEEVLVLRRSSTLDEIVLMFLGDLIENDCMRVSQARRVDRLVTQQTVEATDLVNEVIHTALLLAPKVVVHMVGGNHDRTSPKPGYAGLGELGAIDTFAWLIGAYAERMHQAAIDAGRLEFVNHEAYFGTTLLRGMRVAFEHGASFKASTGSYGGIGYYGIANAARGYKEMLDGADLVLMGHFHIPMCLPLNGGWGWQVVNGALPPSTEFVQSSFKRVGRPCQMLLELSDRGVERHQPLYLETDSMVRPGDVWRKLAAG